jgi:hypothetical protein
MEREDEGWRAVETGCRGGQGSPKAVAPSGRQAGFLPNPIQINFHSHPTTRFYKTVVPKLFQATAPLVPLTHPQCPLPLPCKKHSLEQRFAQPTEKDNNNKTTNHIQ